MHALISKASLGETGLPLSLVTRVQTLTLSTEDFYPPKEQKMFVADYNTLKTTVE